MKVIIENDGNDILNQYIIFSKVIDEQIQKHGRTSEAVLKAIRICRDKDVLKEFLRQYEKEVVDVMVELYTQKEALASYVISERNEGRMEGRKEGAIENSIQTAKNMSRIGLPVSVIAQSLGVSVQQVEEWLQN